MCGIAGYIGEKSAVDVVYDQLKRLEYRGYDSAGIAYQCGSDIGVIKKAGKLAELGKLVPETPSSKTAIGHSRWATHGMPTDLNAHPHYDQFEQIAVIHNGIIENYLELREELVQQGHYFRSETDTEIAAHVIGSEYKEGVALEEAVRRAVKKLRGAYALVILSKREPEKIVATRNASPIVLGIGDNEQFIASDIPALLPYTRKISILEDNKIALLTKEKLVVMDLEGVEQPLDIMEIQWDIKSAERGGYEHFMLKEIYEQPEVIRQCLAGRIDEKNQIRLDQIFSENVWGEIKRICVVACGTAYNAGLVGKYMFESMLRLPTDIYHSSEFRYGDPILSPDTLVIVVSQSGETADTLAAIRLCKERRIRTLGVVNVMGSSIARECDRTVYTQAGPEVSVCSTKAYTAQVLVLTLLSLHIAQVREMPGVRVNEIVQLLKGLSDKVTDLLKYEPKVAEIAKQVYQAPLFFYTGRGVDEYAAYEGALKIKEIAYVATQECSTGELKHGPLALFEKGVIAVVGAVEKCLREKLVSNVKVIQAREGTIVAFWGDEDRQFEQLVDYGINFSGTGYPYVDAIQSVVLMQLLAYHVAKLRGCDIDQPRNLAKSVTVE